MSYDKLQNQSTVYFIDWISARLPLSLMWNDDYQRFEPELLLPLVSNLGIVDKYEACKPRFGYKFAWRGEKNGVIFQVHPERSDMGINVIATGQVLSAIGWRTFLNVLQDFGASFSRIDVSVDIHDASFDLLSLYDNMVRGQVITRSKRHSFVQSTTGSTFYVGARTSEKFLRVYDKGAEQGVGDGHWFRVELECKGAAANFVADLVFKNRISAASQVIKPFFDAPHHVGFVYAMETSHEAINIPSAKKRPDTEAWLMGVVADVAADIESRRPGFVVEWYTHVMSMIKE